MEKKVITKEIKELTLKAINAILLINPPAAREIILSTPKA